MSYGAIVLLSMCFTILALQQLFDAVHYRYRFCVLRKLGVEEDHINRLILKQLGFWFGLPVAVAAIASAIFTSYYLHGVSAQIQAYLGSNVLFVSMGSAVAILIFLLICYFITTWVMFKHSIAEE